jgi:(S)-mandelate dehydrogenase
MNIAQTYSIEDLRELARRRLPRAVFDFIDGGSEGEVTLMRNRMDFDRIEFLPRVLVDVSHRDLCASILGKRTHLPIIIAPTGLAALAWPVADVALAKASRANSVPFTVSTSSSITLERIRELEPQARLWFQAYLYKDRNLVRSLIRRAADVDCEALVLTADVPVLGQRHRDQRNRFTVPLRPAPRLVWDFLRCPRWTCGIIRHGIPRMQNLMDASGPGQGVTALAELMTRNMDSSLNWNDLDWLRDAWRRKLVIKGVLTPADAELAVHHGIDAIAVSNHGGRQLDCAPSSISVLAEICSVVGGRAEIYLDGGVRRGSDIAKALALGARAVMLGRASLYGVAAGGEAGAARALAILHEEFDRCLALIGCPVAADLNEAFLRKRWYPAGRVPSLSPDSKERVGLRTDAALDARRG